MIMMMMVMMVMMMVMMVMIMMKRFYACRAVSCHTDVAPNALGCTRMH